MIINKEKGFFKTKIEIGQFYQDEEGKALSSSDVYLTLREPTEDELFQMGSDSDKNRELLRKLWKECLMETGHNFETAEGVPATRGEILADLGNRGAAVLHIVTRWQELLPLARPNNSK